MQTCVVCFEEVNIFGNECCNMSYHAKCMDTWCESGKRAITCTVCNTSIPSTPGVLVSIKELIDKALTKLEPIADLMVNMLISELNGFDELQLSFVEDNYDVVYIDALNICDMLDSLGEEFSKRPTVSPLVKRAFQLKDRMGVVEKVLMEIRKHLINQLAKYY